MENNINLQNIFLNLQKQMNHRLAGLGANLKHPTTKGDFTELNWIKWLNEYLPKRYEVDKAFVIDSNSRMSEQLDLVIYDRQYSPFVFNENGAKYIPAESVYAVFEVKQELNKENFKYAAQKIKSVRLLTRTSAPIVHAGGLITQPKAPLRILGGVISIRSGWTDLFGSPFQECMRSFDHFAQVDIGCVLNEASFTIKYHEGQYTYEKSVEDETLIYFFLKLLIHLQQLGTVPAMDIEAYARAIRSI